MVAAQDGHESIVGLLLDRGADVNVQSKVSSSLDRLLSQWRVLRRPLQVGCGCVRRWSEAGSEPLAVFAGTLSVFARWRVRCGCTACWVAVAEGRQHGVASAWGWGAPAQVSGPAPGLAAQCVHRAGACRWLAGRGGGWQP